MRVVARRALALDVGGPVVVTSDDERVLDAVSGLPVDRVLTHGRHGSGTERVAEVMARPEYADTDVVLNLQGDEPFVPRDALEGAVARVVAGDEIGTAAQPPDGAVAGDPDTVKVEIDRSGRALRFFRTTRVPDAENAVMQHLGVYAYTPAALARWVALPPHPDEVAERLEQLRPLRAGWRIGVAVTEVGGARPIDTEEDLRLAEAML